MTLNVDAIITLVSAVPALLIASLSTWLAYLTLRRHNISHNDIESSAIEFLVSHASTTSSSLEMQTSSTQAPTTLSSSSEDFPQLQFPPVALLGDFERTPRRPRLLPNALSDERHQTVEE